MHNEVRVTYRADQSLQFLNLFSERSYQFDIWILKNTKMIELNDILELLELLELLKGICHLLSALFPNTQKQIALIRGESP